MELSNEDRRGLQRAGAAASEYNATMFAVEEVLNSDVNTAWVGVVDSVQSGSGDGSGVANVTPLVAHTDADGQSLPMSSIPALPYTRVQYGIAALIIEPVPGDRVACVSCKDDISNVGPGVTRPQRPGSYRKFDQSDSVIVGALHTKAPEVYIRITQDKKIYIKAPAGYTLETDADVEVKAGGSVTVKASQITLDANVKITGSLEVGTISSSGGVTLDTPSVHMTGNLSVDGHIHGN